MYKIAELAPSIYRLRDIKKSFIVDTQDGNEWGWCNSIRLVCYSFLAKESYVELEFFKNGRLTCVGYSIERFSDLVPTPKQYTYQDVLSDLHFARQTWLQAPNGFVKRMWDAYMNLAKLQPYLLDSCGVWSWTQYSQSIALHLISTVDEPTLSDVTID